MSHFLYRMWDEYQDLLYVGISGHPLKRWSQHAARKEWWGRVARIEAVSFPSRAEAATAERQAIIDEEPEFNVTHADEGPSWWRLVERTPDLEDVETGIQMGEYFGRCPASITADATIDLGRLLLTPTERAFVKRRFDRLIPDVGACECHSYVLHDRIVQSGAAPWFEEAE